MRCVVYDFLESFFDGKYYVGYQNAAQLHGVAEQMPLSISIITLNQRRPLHVGNQKIDFRKISASNFFGIKKIKYSDVLLNVSDKEKTIIDCLERYNICGGIDEVARTISNAVEDISEEKLLNYLEKFNSKPVLQRMGYILDKLLQNGFDIDKKILTNIEKLAGQKTYLLEARTKENGRHSKRWKIIENIDPLSWLHV